MLLLQDFEFNIVHTLGKSNTVADFHSRLETGELGNGINDDLLDAYIFTTHALVLDSHHDQLLVSLIDGMMPVDLSIANQRRELAL